MIQANRSRGRGIVLLLLLVAAAGGAAADLVRHTVSADGHPLAVWEKSAPGAAQAVLLVHGRTWSALPDFDLQVEGEDLSLMDGLVEAGYAVFAVDLRGYGETPRDDSGWLTPGRAAADVAVVLEWIDGRHSWETKPHLFGWSMGSTISQLAAQRFPEAMALAADPVRVDLRGFSDYNELDPAKVTVPTLVIAGEHDPLAPAENQAKLYMGIGTGHKQWVTVPGGDHAAFLETPRAYFLRELTAFLAGVGK